MKVVDSVIEIRLSGELLNPADQQSVEPAAKQSNIPTEPTASLTSFDKRRFKMFELRNNFNFQYTGNKKGNVRDGYGVHTFPDGSVTSRSLAIISI